MKNIGKGWLIVTGFFLVLAVISLVVKDYQALGSDIEMAVIFFAIGFALSKKKKPSNVTTKKADTALTIKDIPDQSSDSFNQEKKPLSSSTIISSDLEDLTGSTFGAWDISIHDAQGQDVRFDRARSQKIVILSFKPDTGLAEIAGTHGDIYQVDLDHCTCEDFQRRQMPCKHIYKLALARGYSEDAFFSARSDTVWYMDGGRVYHTSPDCRGLRNKISRYSTVAMAEHKSLRPCKSCASSK